MSNTTRHKVSSPIESISGYVGSFVVFTGITALWVFLVRGDEFYATTPLFGIEIPMTTAFYLLTMPALGFLAGQWRFYHVGPGQNGSLITRALARTLNFFYSHILIALFTVAMVSRELFAVNIDAMVETVDDSLFIVASRFAPWLSAYLAGFNLGRALGLRGWAKAAIIENDDALSADNNSSAAPAPSFFEPTDASLADETDGYDTALAESLGVPATSQDKHDWTKPSALSSVAAPTANDPLMAPPGGPSAQRPVSFRRLR